jgi:hypothetical protein
MSIGPGGYVETLRSTFTVVKAVPNGNIAEGCPLGFLTALDLRA